MQFLPLAVTLLIQRVKHQQRLIQQAKSPSHHLFLFGWWWKVTSVHLLKCCTSVYIWGTCTLLEHFHFMLLSTSTPPHLSHSFSYFPMFPSRMFCTPGSDNPSYFCVTSKQHRTGSPWSRCRLFKMTKSSYQCSKWDYTSQCRLTAGRTAGSRDPDTQ